MKNYILIYLFFHCAFVSSYGQQIANWSSFYENGFIWNPAMTAKWNAMDVSLTHQEMWTGFDGAPKYSTLSFQYPFINMEGRPVQDWELW